MARSPAAQLDHVVLEVRDPLVSATFYQKVLGFAPVRLAEYRSGSAPFVSARINAGALIDFFPKPMWRSRRRAENPNHFCLTFSRGASKAIEARLGRARIPITRRSARNYGALGYGVAFYFDDPDKISVEVRYYGPLASRR